MKIKFNVRSFEHILIEKLTPFQGELKTLSEENHNKLRSEIIDDGFNFAPHIWVNDGKHFILDGHQRIHVLKQLAKQGYVFEYRNGEPLDGCVPCSFVEADDFENAKRKVLQAVSQYGKLTDKGFKDFTAGCDFKLSNYDFPDFIVPDADRSYDSDDSDDENMYSMKIEAPDYEPTGEKPKLDDLLNAEKRDQLKAKIMEADIDQESKTLLLEAAQRHIVFNYENIAEFYSHASQEVQNLMEDSALVIIDFNKAIKDGFIKMSKELAEVSKDG